MKEVQLSYPHKATIYLIRDLGIGYAKIEVQSFKVWTQNYAQFENAVVAKFVRKRKRKSESIIQTIQPSFVAFEDWNLPDLPDHFEEPKSKDGITIRKARYTNFSEQWRKEFDKFHENSLSELKEIIDLRNFKVYEKEIKRSIATEVETENPNYKIPEEVINPDEIFEGAKKRIAVNSYERNSKARQACIKKYGTGCYICGTILAEKYGDLAKDYIHVHHLQAISKIGKKYKIDPIKDLRPLCPNCHSIIHLKDPPFTIKEMKKMINQ